MSFKHHRELKAGLLLSAAWLLSSPAWPQDRGGAAPPADAPAAEQGTSPAAGGGQDQLPQVDVIQKKQPDAEPATQRPKKPKPKPAPVEAAAPKPKPVAKKAAPPPEPEPEPAAAPSAEAEPAVEAAAPSSSPIYGAANTGGATARTESSAQAPINASSIAPGNLEKFSSAASRIDSADIAAQQPRQIQDVFKSVPGVHVVNDDGYGRHGGVGMRGSPPRRSRKIMTMEDGQSINMSTWIDPSVHYQPPVDRIESVEVVRGTAIVHGPNNNHGIVNYVNLSPFGPNETEIGASIGSTSHDGGSEGNGDSPWGLSNTRHFHTRQDMGNAGVVLSYSGAEVDGVWDLERLRYNDFYGAIGWKGVDQDFTFSATYFRQRDNYDEANLTGDEDDGEPGEVEERFYKGVGHAKSIFNPGSRFNTYSADMVKLQGVHNYYLDDDTTITSRLYGFHHQRDRYQNVDGADPSEEDDGLSPIIDGDEIFLPEGVMLGRLRTYRQFGGEVRAEFANRPFLGGMTQDIQTGIRYEYNDFTNRNFFGRQGEILEYGDEKGTTAFNTGTDANAVSAFLQTSINVTQDFKAVPGVRVDHYRISRDITASTKEEGEAEECEDDENPFGDEECVVLEGFDNASISESFDKTHVLPGVALSYSGFFRSTVYGGYHRGLTMGVLREANTRFPPTDELGDNFQLGLRSTAIRGVTFDIAGFHHAIQDFQVKGAATDASGNNVYTTIDKVHINGFEVMGRLDTKAYTGNPFNLYFEGTYTLSDATIKKGTLFETDEDEPGEIEAVNLRGNEVPEVPTHVAHLTVGVAHDYGWDASISWTYRSAFFTDEGNTPFGGDVEGEDGEVPGVWLLSARANMKLADTGASIFIAGDNLLDELYISDREDGIKPGQGRTIWGGFNYKF